MRYTRNIALSVAVTALAVGLAFASAIVASGGAFEGISYQALVLDVTPFLPAPFHIMLAGFAVATVAACLSFVLAPPAARATRFRRFLDVWWDRRHFYRRALA